MNRETPKSNTLQQDNDQAIALANSARETSHEVGEDATILKFPDIQQSAPPQSGDNLIDSYGQAVAERQSPQQPESWSRRHNKNIRRALVAATLLFAGKEAAPEVADAFNGPDFHGEKTVTINSGDTVDDIANNEVDGGASHTGDTVNKIVAMNPDVFQDGKAFIESEDLGKEIAVPESVE